MSRKDGPQATNKSSSERAGKRAIFEQGYDGRMTDREERVAGDEPDLNLDVPSLGIEELNLDVENLRARVSLHAELADMVKLNVGVEADVDKVKLEAKGVDAQLLLKASLDNVRAILSQALEAIDNNPGILEELMQSSDRSSGGAGRALEGAAEPASEEGVDGGTEPSATPAARRKAEELGINLSQVEGTGAGGRILIRDVKKAAN